jgi:hypothetical protein
LVQSDDRGVGWIASSLGSWFERVFRFQTRSESIRPFKPKFLSADCFVAACRTFAPLVWWTRHRCSVLPSSAWFGKAHRATHARARKAHPATPRGLRTRASPSGAAVVSHEEGALAHARCARARGIRFLRPSGGTSRRPRFGADDAAAPASDPARRAPRRAFGVGFGARGTSAPPPRTRRAPRGGRASGPRRVPRPRLDPAAPATPFASGMRASPPFFPTVGALTRPTPVPRAGRTRAWRPRPAETPLRRHGGQGRARHPGPQPRQGGRRRPPRPGAPSPPGLVVFF